MIKELNANHDNDKGLCGFCYIKRDIFELLKNMNIKELNEFFEKKDIKDERHLTKYKEITNIISKNSRFIFYGGADKENSHTNFKYWKQIKDSNEVAPKNYFHCLCMQCITNPHYIKDLNTGKLYIVGSECINKFVNEDMQGRRCKICLVRHNNRKDAYCNDCRIIINKELKINKKKYEKVILEFKKEYIWFNNHLQYIKCDFGKFKNCKCKSIFDLYHLKNKTIINYIKWAISVFDKNKKNDIYHFLKLFQEYNKKRKLINNFIL